MAKPTVTINTPNKVSNFRPCDDQWILKQMPIVASVAMEAGTALGVEIVTNTTTGNLKKMGTTGASGANFTGILAEPIAATDADYATAGKLKGVWIPRNQTAEAEFTVWAGTFTLVDVYKTVQFHSDSKSLAVDTAGLGAVITGYISATRGTCEFSCPKTQTA